MLRQFTLFSQPLGDLRNCKVLISTLNAHCYNIALTDPVYREALLNSDVLIPDGVSVVLAIRWLTGQRLKKIAGADLFVYEMERLQSCGGKCFFLGSSETTLATIKDRAAREYPNVIVQSYSPPYKPEFTAEDNASMLGAINAFQPDVLFVGMTAPKQEKWAYQHFAQLQTGHVCCIGAVFDFYAGTVNRAPQWMINLGLEWFCRLAREPRRMWRRYLLGNAKFVWAVIKEKMGR
jgi:N-acetylglucosaminyldiphosphoundecaprenol N-acetyl-beta-D-mannosaminyltransferase